MESLADAGYCFDRFKSQKAEASALKKIALLRKKPALADTGVPAPQAIASGYKDLGNLPANLAPATWPKRPGTGQGLKKPEVDISELGARAFLYRGR